MTKKFILLDADDGPVILNIDTISRIDVSVSEFGEKFGDLKYKVIIYFLNGSQPIQYEIESDLDDAYKTLENLLERLNEN